MEPTQGSHVHGTEIRELRDIDELRACEAVQQDVWGFDLREVVPASHMRAVQHAGGMVLGAVAAGRVVGFAYGFLARPLHPWETGSGVHSHMVAVRPAFQRSGVGRGLKWAQRRWCLERDLDWMTWTFDPIQGKNARLNFHHLGARSHTYLEDFYGVLGGPLAGAIATDRLVAFWDLRDPRVADRARRFEAGDAGEPVADLPGSGGEAWLLREGADGEPAAPPRPWSAEPSNAAEGGAPPSSAEAVPPCLRVAVPVDATALFREDAERASRWRIGVRAALQEALAHGYVIGGFAERAYVLRRPAEPSGKPSQ